MSTDKKDKAASLAELAGKYLAFELSDEIYGIEILKVQELIGMMKVTRVPRVPHFIKGIINLRGKVIPVIDLRLKFGLPTLDISEKTCIIVVQITRENSKIIIGLMVDEVSEVIDIKTEQIEIAPSFGSSVNTDFLLGIGKVNDKVIMLMEVDQVLSVDELSDVADIA
ncbi:MAG: chemotaxis protein CheW [Candidatus Wallbacteria bacterium HGW-Wallbacteria-1]|jgi:purine-binding chemotaxis protein CheW|uniref:Chemotaxis protein CheW n=1 Tax=Candidatus Wallbacteria bacterium HGW-Wallbacteria-1 TaxID=2013854 RepID=A0A2N1PKE3_9BACT|nr:MAG: chemotaxis protein CheW [Candidatus Wallbacteria bacterium HGW-Wallbacteria-1]